MTTSTSKISSNKALKTVFSNPKQKSAAAVVQEEFVYRLLPILECRFRSLLLSLRNTMRTGVNVRLKDYFSSPPALDRT